MWNISQERKIHVAEKTKKAHVNHLYVEVYVDDTSSAVEQIDVQLIQREFLEELAEITLQQIPAGPLLDVRRPNEPRHFAQWE